MTIPPSCYSHCSSAVISCGSLRVTTTAPGGLTLQLSASPETVGSRAVYSCSNSNYILVGGAERVCGADGNWTGVEPRCEGLYYLTLNLLMFKHTETN